MYAHAVTTMMVIILVHTERVIKFSVCVPGKSEYQSFVIMNELNVGPAAVCIGATVC